MVQLHGPFRTPGDTPRFAVKKTHLARWVFRVKKKVTPFTPASMGLVYLHEIHKHQLFM